MPVACIADCWGLDVGFLCGGYPLMKYRKKPIDVEAVQIVPDKTAIHQWPPWLRRAMNKDWGSPGALRWALYKDYPLEIYTLEGVMEVHAYDWIICGIEGEIYHCKPQIFDKTYEVCEA